MSDFFPEAQHINSMFALENLWRYLNWVDPDALPMTKAETITRREEAMKMHWPMFVVDTTYYGPVDVDDSRLCRPVNQLTQYPCCSDRLNRLNRLERERFVNIPLIRDCGHERWHETYNSVECPDCGKVW